MTVADPRGALPARAPWGNLENLYVGVPSWRVDAPPRRILDPPIHEQCHRCQWCISPSPSHSIILSSLTLSLYHPFTLSLSTFLPSHYLTPLSFHSHSDTLSTSHYFTLSLIHPLTLSPSHYFTLSLFHPLTISPSHPLTLSPSHSFTLTFSECKKRKDVHSLLPVDAVPDPWMLPMAVCWSSLICC